MSTSSFNREQPAAELGTGQCRSCAHFRNSPEYLESVYPGMTTMSSGYASVRKEDGICLRHDLYLSADAHCDEYVRHQSGGERGS